MRHRLLILTLLLAGCASPVTPAPALIRDTPPPWPAPRDGVAYLEQAGLPQSRLDDRSNQRTFQLQVVVDGLGVEVPAYLGMDRPRAVQGPAHTHDTSGLVWLEGRGADQVTLGQLFTSWGVRFDGRCLGAACGMIAVTSDGRPVADPVALRLADVASTVVVDARS